MGFNAFRWWSNGSNSLVQSIYTSVSTTSGSNNSTPYVVNFENNNSQICNNSIPCGSNWQPAIVSNFDDGQAIDIAEDSIDYYTFPEVSEWVAQYDLYSDLEMDSILLASNSILNSFYQTKRFEDLGILRSVEQWINLLSDSSSRIDSVTFLNRWYAAMAANDSVSGTEDFIQNEKWVNYLMLEFLRYGRDSLSSEELEQLQALAHSCPAVDGLGVFSARYLYTFYEPLTDYDDYQLCNGSNKGGKGPFDDFLDFLIGSQELSKTGHEMVELKLFPVPANNVLNFELNEQTEQPGQFEIFDLMGNLVAEGNKPGNLKSGQILTTNIVSGIYVCRYTCGKDVFFGKVNIIH